MTEGVSAGEANYPCGLGAGPVVRAPNGSFRRRKPRLPKDPMKNRVVRVPDRVWDAAKTRADERGESVSAAVRRFLERYGK